MKTSTILVCSACKKEIGMWVEFEDRNGKFFHSPGCLRTMEVKEQPKIVTTDLKEKD